MPDRLNIRNFIHGGDYNPDQWTDHPEIIAKDFEMFKEARINSVTVGIFAWDKLEPSEGTYDFSWLDDVFDRAEKQGCHVILSTPSGARPRWMAEKYPEVLRVDETGRRQLFGERHNHCYTSPVYRKKVQEINRKLAERYGKRESLVLWHISNEYGGECHCELCQQEFRNWMQAKYKTLDNLNRCYWNEFWSHLYTSWDQIHSPSSIGDSNVLGLNLDWHRFVTDRTIDFFENEIAPLRELTPNIPVTTNFMGGNPPDSHVFYDLDYQKFAKHVDIVSWDSYPNWANGYETTEKLAAKTALMNDVMHGLKHQNYLIMENTPSQVNWHPVNRAKLPGMHQMGSLQEIAHGADSVMYFQLHQSRGASEMFHGAVITNKLSNKTRVFKDVKQVGEALDSLAEAKDSKRLDAKVAIVFDYDNMWALDDARAYSNQSKKYWETIQRHYKAFWDRDIPVDIVSVEDDLSRYELIIDPMHFMMTTEFAAKLQEFVKAGGTLVGTYVNGIVDENFLTYLGPGMDAWLKTYGLEVTETDTLYPEQKNKLEIFGKTYDVCDYCDLIEPETAKTIGTYGDCFYKGTPAVTENKLGKGTAWYLGCSSDDEFLSDFYEKLDQDLNLALDLPVKKASSKVSVQVRRTKEADYFFIINFGHEEQNVEISRRTEDVLTRETHEKGSLVLGAYDVKVLKETR